MYPSLADVENQKSSRNIPRNVSRKETCVRKDLDGKVTLVRKDLEGEGNISIDNIMRLKGGTGTSGNRVKQFYSYDTFDTVTIDPKKTSREIWTEYIKELRIIANGEQGLPETNESLNNTIAVLVVTSDEIRRMVSPNTMFSLGEAPPCRALEFVIYKNSESTMDSSITIENKNPIIKNDDTIENSGFRNAIENPIIKNPIKKSGFSFLALEIRFHRL